MHGPFFAFCIMVLMAVKAMAEEEQQQRSRGISRYIKRRKLEPLETYVPAVLAARSQLEQAGNKMSKDRHVFAMGLGYSIRCMTAS